MWFLDYLLVPLHLVRFREQFLSTLLHKFLSILDCGHFALRIYLSIVKTASNHRTQGILVQVTIGVLCYNVYLNDLRYWILLIWYQIDLNRFFLISDRTERI